MIKTTVSPKGQIVIPGKLKIASGFPDWRTMQGMVRTGPSLTRAIEEDHRAELERDDVRLEGL